MDNNIKMIGGVFSILEKEPPTNKPILIASYFDANNNIVRYKIGMYRMGRFFTNNSEILNVGFWSELQNVEIIEHKTYQEFSREKLKENASFWVKKYLKYKEDYYNSDEYLHSKIWVEDDYLLKKFLETYDY